MKTEHFIPKFWNIAKTVFITKEEKQKTKRLRNHFKKLGKD